MGERELFFGTMNLMDIFDTILTSFPEGILIFLIGLALFNQPMRKWWPQATAVGVAYSVGMHAVYYYEFRVDFKFLALFLLLIPVSKIMTGYSWIRAIAMVSIGYSFSLIGYLIMFATLDFFQVTMFDFFTTHLYLYIGMSGYLLFLALVVFILRKNNVDIREWFPRASNPRPLIYLGMIITALTYVLILTTLAYYLGELDETNLSMFSVSNRASLAVIALLLFGVAIWVFRNYLKYTVDRVEQETSHSYGHHIQDLLTAMSAIRHDVTNHLTVIEGLMKKGMEEKALAYVQTLNKEHAEVVEQVDGIVDPSVASLIASKAQVCQKNGIQLFTRLQTAKQFGFLESVDLVRVVGNLLDNAITATMKRPLGERHIHIVWTDGMMSIENSGPELNQAFIDRMFSLGVTSKKSGGGSGLAIVRNTIRKYGGEIDVQSIQGMTRFTISFQSKLKSQSEPIPDVSSA